MIDILQRISQFIRILRLPSIALGVLSLSAIVAILFVLEQSASDRFLFPSFVGLIWSLSSYNFIVTFRSTPEKATAKMGLLERLEHNIHRGWYWIIGVIFLGSTITALMLTLKIGSIWLSNNNG